MLAYLTRQSERSSGSGLVGRVEADGRGTVKDLVLVRIDDRLIHGQIATQWLKTTHANKVLVMDDALPDNAFQVRILKAAAPSGIKVVVKDVEGGVAWCLREPKEDERVMVLVKVPETIEALIDGGISLHDVILGGMGFKEGRSRINRNVSASPEEVECMQRIVARGTRILYQLVPSDAPKDLNNVLAERE